VNLAFWEAAPASTSGPAVILLHGFPLASGMWRSQLEELSREFRVVTPDLRGHGRSPAPVGSYSMEELAADVIELADRLGITEPMVVGGLSMGGYVALALALAYPRRLRGLMLVDTRAAADTPEAASGRIESARRVLAAGSAAEVIQALVPRLFAASTRQRHPERIEPIVEMMRQTPVHGVAGALLGMAGRPDRRAELGRIDVPTLVLVGEEDEISPPEEARAMAAALPRGRLELVPEAGHLAPYENPAAVSDAMLRFLRDLA
jgi:3-oxoadipate enol-lactonase